MSNGRRKYKRKGGQKHVQLMEFTMRSEAWKALDPVARCLYVEIKRRYDGFNNGAIGLGCREAAEALNVGKDTANRAFLKLQSHGFIAVAKRSGFNMKSRVSTEWRLTEYSCDVTGELPTKDFMRWRPVEKSTVASQVATVSSQGPSPVERVA